MNNNWRSKITFEAGKRGGRPCIRGMRITVYDVLSYLAAGMTNDQIISDFPYLTLKIFKHVLHLLRNASGVCWHLAYEASFWQASRWEEKCTS